MFVAGVVRLCELSAEHLGFAPVAVGVSLLLCCQGWVSDCIQADALFVSLGGRIIQKSDPLLQFLARCADVSRGFGEMSLDLLLERIHLALGDLFPLIGRKGSQGLADDALGIGNLLLLLTQVSQRQTHLVLPDGDVANADSDEQQRKNNKNFHDLLLYEVGLILLYTIIYKKSMTYLWGLRLLRINIKSVIVIFSPTLPLRGMIVEVLLLILLIVCVALCSYVAYVVHGMTGEKALPPAKVTAALEERVSRIVSSLSEDEWKRVAAGDTSILVAKAAYSKHDTAIRDGLVKQLKDVEANHAKLTREYVSNAGSGYSGLAAVSKKGMEHLEARAKQLRKEIKEHS